MKALLIYSCFLCLTISCNTNTQERESSAIKEPKQITIDDSTVYSVLSYLLENKSSNPFLKYDKVVETAQMPFFFLFKNDSLKIVALDSIFNSRDIEYMLAQKEQFNKFKIEQSKLKNKIIISKDSDELPKNRRFCYISFPVFNANKDKFIIWAGYVCGGLCGEGATFIYQKKGKDWIKIYVLNQTIS